MLFYVKPKYQKAVIQSLSEFFQLGIGWIREGRGSLTMIKQKFNLKGELDFTNNFSHQDK